jgi:hypothetical protein
MKITKGKWCGEQGMVQKSPVPLKLALHAFILPNQCTAVHVYLSLMKIIIIIKYFYIKRQKAPC